MKKLTVSLMAKAKKAAVIILTFLLENFLTGSYYARIVPNLQTVVGAALLIFCNYFRLNPPVTRRST